MTDYLNVGLAVAGYLYIMFKTGEWLASIIWKQWYKRKKEERKQKAINELYDAFNLGELTDSGTLKAVTKNGLTIMMFRK
ncbi:DUF4752 domain-containing protein [Yersinia enterocolitica]|uniref:DUF4752 family protein n=1 Tax=Yersinia enterocolitica TaxID=630 RepID=UPI0005E479A5|nr:DUF4752 family protein [Yersinia enterocolitica]AOF18400.1 DUF4752 domain-containing protein [Yersinia enterocolitica]AOF22931.1 DUF4752 domain-containing protein [Yersinia enterocolitica]AOF26641.1 DUF4752 domain-containing protein [Yersinia enterocolitica]AOF30754.1 DUF4752 domain-containing protein [Yersinia enterocolitica]AOF34674.1 DUF4752 domain-containing protein [Yersinia enterocolitica]